MHLRRPLLSFFVPVKHTIAITLRGLALAAALSVSGCADAYRDSADRDVYKILHDRKRETLGYEPQAVVGGPARRASRR